MLPEIQLKRVSKDDVDRVAWWLDDDEISSKWFGHYGCGDPVHRGYDPLHMVEASEMEWKRVFEDSRRQVYSVYCGNEHIGECQIILEAEVGAELLLLIGRKDLWHQGYGTATVMAVMELIFGDLQLERVRVRIPEDNQPALGLFQKLGFVHQETDASCRRPNSGALTTTTLSMDMVTFLSRWRNSERQHRGPAITVNGLAGSGSENLSQKIARITGRRFVDTEISERICHKLSSGPTEIEGFESAHRSLWTRWLNAIVVPMEWSATYDIGYQWSTLEAPSQEDLGPADRITKKNYVEALASAVRHFATESNVVICGHGSQLFAPSHPDSLNVFVYAPFGVRVQRISSDYGWSIHESEKWLKRSDKDALSVFKSLLGVDIQDVQLYDLVVNLDRITEDNAAHTIVEAANAQAIGQTQLPELRELLKI
jgi:cytidylate kinase